MKISLKSVLSILILPAFLLLCLGTLAQAQFLEEGQLIVADEGAGTNGDGAVFLVFLTNGRRLMLSDFGDPSQGPIGNDPLGIALSEDLQSAYVVDDDGVSGSGLLFHVNLDSGERIIISDFDDPAQGPTGSEPTGIAVVGTTAYVIDDDAGAGGDGILFHVDLITGDREIISEFGNPAQGPTGETPQDLLLDGAGGAYVTDTQGVTPQGTLFHVDLTSGDRIVVSDFSNPAQGNTDAANPYGIAMADSDNAFVTDEDGPNGPVGNGALYLVNLTTGFRTLLTNFGDPNQGPGGSEPEGVTTNDVGQPLVADRNGGTEFPNNRGSIVLVDVATGDRTVISDFGNPAQGPIGADPTGIAYRPATTNVPTLSAWGLIAMAGLLGIIGFMVARKRKLTV